ncbi:nucleoside diphosphate-linked moiety X motif 8 isoform X2 [Nasonia vitripennis]|uniref:Nudix hydrolase domain-containing protein n=1 Tax=Nasonia vitripennis TaxID=7425 RepID=A0A7M7H989_NASVI|nr:nucleoside diphosphate-linked moiety X motif 8 isoform X2 [Nasonia vitripennis]
MILRTIRRKAESFLPLSLWLKSQRKLSTTELAQLTPEAILNDQVRAACIKRLKLISLTKKSGNDASQAAVLVPLCGKKDNNDATLEDTALRETWEELHIPRDTVDVWGSGNLVERKHVSVLPVLGFIGEVDPKSLPVNTHEVEEAFVQPLEKLCDPQFCRYTQFRDNYTLPTYIGGDHKIWGLTAVITHLVMSALVPGVYKHKIAYLKPIRGESEKSSTSSKAQKS